MGSIFLNMNKADPYRPALLSLGDVYAMDFGFTAKQESFGFIAIHKGGIEDVMLYKIIQIHIKLLIFYMKYGYFVSCFLEVREI